MKKSELMNGDIVVLRSGCVGVVIGEGADAYLLYQYGGMEFLDECFDEELRFDAALDDDMVMQVFRPEGGFGFEGVDREEPIWERDEAWLCPTENEREEQHRMAVEQHKAEFEAMLERMSEARKDRIRVVAQGFYGNRTATAIDRDRVDCFLNGILSPELFSDEEKKAERKIVRVPGSEHVVIVYNQKREYESRDEALAAVSAGKPRISCSIPEIGLELHTLCFACRMDEKGELQSLENGDAEAFMKYFPM